MKSPIVAFAVGLVAFSLVFVTMDYVVMDMQGLSLIFEQEGAAHEAAAEE
jgi:hypothetical protein|tara:strand:- start:219 stop:368 length:150 start_codon:yes stop_codon:yes gene_type:complete